MSNLCPKIFANAFLLVFLSVCISCTSHEAKKSEEQPEPAKISDRAKVFLSDYESTLRNQEEQRRQEEEQKEASEKERMTQILVNQTLEELLPLDPQKDARRIDELISDLKEIGDPAVEALEDMLTENRPVKERIILVKALGAFKNSKSGEELYNQAIKSPDREVRDAALNSLKETTAKDTLANKTIDGMQERTPEEQMRAIAVLGVVGGDSALSEIINIIGTTEDDNVKKQAIISLGEMGGETAISTLTDVFKNDGKMSVFAAQALGKMKQEDIVLQFSRTLLSEEATAELKAAAVGGLGADNGELARTILINALRDTRLTREVHEKAIEALLTGFNEKTKHELALYCGIFEATPVDYLPQMMQPLLARGEDLIVDTISSRYQYLSETKKIHAIRTLARIPTKKSFAALTSIFQNEQDVNLKRECLSAMRNFKGEEFTYRVAGIAEELLGSVQDRETIIISIDIVKTLGNDKSKNTLLAFEMKDQAGEYKEKIEDAIKTIDEREK